MESFYVSLLVLFSLGLFYILLNLRLSQLVERRFRQLYKTTLQSDMAEFYREMESYSSLLESRIQRYKNLVERQESNLRKWEEVASALAKSKRGKELSEILNRSEEKEKQLKEAIELIRKKQEPEPARAPVEPVKTAKKPVASSEEKAPAARVNVKEPAPKKAAAKPETPLPDDGEFSLAEELLQEIDRKTPAPAVEKKVASRPAVPEKKPVAPVSGQKTVPVWQKVLSGIGQAFSPVVPPVVTSESAPAAPVAFEVLMEQKKQSLARPAAEKDITPVSAEKKARLQHEEELRQAKDSFLSNLESSPALNAPLEAQKDHFFRSLQSRNPVLPPEKPARVQAQAAGISRQFEEVGEIGRRMESQAPLEEKKPKLTPEELSALLNELHLTRKRPIALKSLLDSGFSLMQVSDLSEISYSELQLTRNIYRL